jgi:hypothetical protein
VIVFNKRLGVDSIFEIVADNIGNDVDKTGEIVADNIWSCAEIISVIVLIYGSM